MMWYLQLFVEHASAQLAEASAINFVFAALALWAGFGNHPRTCAVLVAAIHVLTVSM